MPNFEEDTENRSFRLFIPSAGVVVDIDNNIIDDSRNSGVSLNSGSVQDTSDDSQYCRQNWQYLCCWPLAVTDDGNRAKLLRSVLAYTTTIAAIILHVIAVSTPYWLTTKDQNWGFWEICTNGTCLPMEPDATWMIAQVLEFYGILSAVVTLVVIEWAGRRQNGIFCPGCLLTGALWLTAMFMSQNGSNNKDTFPLHSGDPSWSFYLALTSLFVLASPFLILCIFGEQTCRGHCLQPGPGFQPL